VKTVIIGTGGHARVVLDVLNYDRNIEVVAFVDKEKHGYDEKIMDTPVLGYPFISSNLFKNKIKGAIVGVGDNKIRKSYYEEFRDMDIELINAIHPAVHLSRNAKIGKGVLIAAGATIATGAEIGNNVIVNTGAIIEHEDILEDHVHIAPGTVLAGRVKVKEGAFIGAGCVVKQYVTIGENAIIGAGSVVLEDIPENSVAVGAPAKVIKRIS